MGYECSKAIVRRLGDSRFATRYFVGKGIDIGSGSPELGNVDWLGAHKHLFPLMTDCRPWDVEDGDAQFMEGVPDHSFDFVHSAHTLEHMVDPFTALCSWWNILKPGGHLVVIVPDEDLYEQGEWPSRFNGGHLHTFTIHKLRSWSPISNNLVDLLPIALPGGTILKIELLDRANAPSTGEDQTGGIAESAIEFIVRKSS
jgi:SAM-dependent methyltransferase